MIINFILKDTSYSIAHWKLTAIMLEVTLSVVEDASSGE